MKNDNLPPKWVYISFLADKPGPEHLKTAYNGHQYQDYEYVTWVAFGSLAEVKAKINDIWEAARAGHNLELREVDYYPNNYKPRSRACIKEGRYTP